MDLLFILIFIILICGAYYKIGAEIKLRNELDYQLQLLKDFKITNKIIGVDNNSALAFDETQKKIYIIYKAIGSQFQKKIYNFIDILSSEILEDGYQILKTSRTSQLGGALLGGIVSGGVGAIIGGLSGKQKEINKVKKIDLQIVFNDLHSPAYILNFLNIEVSKSSNAYNIAITNAKLWYNLISVMIKQAEKN